MASHLPLEILHPIIQYALDSSEEEKCCAGRHAKPPFDIIRGVSCASQVLRQVALMRWFRVFRLRDRSDWDYASNIAGFWTWIRVLVYIEKTVDTGKNFKSSSPTSTLSIASLKQSLTPRSQSHLASTDSLLPGLRTVAIVTNGHNLPDREAKRPFYSFLSRSPGPSRLSCSEILDTFPQMVNDLEMTFDSPGDPFTLLRELEGILMNITHLTLTCSTIFDKDCDPGPSTRFHWRAMVIPHSFDSGREYGEFLAKELAPLVNLQDLKVCAYLTDYAALHNCSEHQNRIPVAYAGAGESQNCLVCQREYHKLTRAEEIAGSMAIATESGLRKLQRIRWASWYNDDGKPLHEDGVNKYTKFNRYTKFNTYLIRRRRDGDLEGEEDVIIEPPL